MKNRIWTLGVVSQKILGVVVNTVAIVAVAVLALFASPASAGVTWNGDVNPFSTSDWTGGSNPATPPNHGWTFGNTDANANAAGASSLLVTDATLLATVFNLDSTLSAAELVRANGYFWEARVKTISHTGSQQSLGIIQRDDLQDGFGVYLYPSQIQWFDGNFANGSTFSAPTHFTADPSGYITVRLDVAAGDNFATMTINGTKVGTKNHDTGNNAGPHFSVGDHIGNVQDDASSHWDYVTINQEYSGVSSPATEFTWTADDVGNWATGSDWSFTGPASSGIANDPNHTAIFADAITTDTTAVTNAHVTLNRIQFANTSNTYNIAGVGSVSLAATTDANNVVNPSMSVQGTHQFQAVVNLNAATTANVDSGSTLTLNNALNLNGQTLTKTGLGMMEINNVLNAGGGTVILQQGTLSGRGTVGGNVTNDGGTISPGSSTAAAQGVPEPSAALLVVLSVLALFATRWHRGG